jgi:hypothetical protein
MKVTVNRQAIAWRVIEGQAFIINTKESTLHELDETGTLLWKVIEKGGSVEEAARELCGRYEVSMERALSDAREFVSALEKKGILTLSAKP